MTLMKRWRQRVSGSELKRQIELLTASARTVPARGRHSTCLAGSFTSLKEMTSSLPTSLSNTQSSDSAIGKASIALLSRDSRLTRSCETSYSIQTLTSAQCSFCDSDDLTRRSRSRGDGGIGMKNGAGDRRR